MAGDLWLESNPGDRGKRLDQFLRERLPQYSRSRLQDWIEHGHVLLNGSPGKRSYLLKGAERINVQPAELPPLRATPEDLPLDVLYEDGDVIAINKPAGMVVHTGAGIPARWSMPCCIALASFQAWEAICGPASCIDWTASPAV